jgi:[acyl-carrier-protein] S-malonyltransferase
MLNRTEYTQPALLAASIGVWRAWNAVGGPRRRSGRPQPGEYTALVAAGALSLHDGAHLVRLRGQLMQEAAPAGVGAMAAVLGAEDRWCWTSAPKPLAARWWCRPTSTRRARS